MQLKKWIITLAYWGCWGFALGTIFLMGPVRHTVTYARNNNWSDGKEKVAVLMYIGVLAFVSFLLARYTASMVMQQFIARSTKLINAVLPVFFAGLAVYVLMTPSLVNADNTGSTDLSTQFTIGPYPSRSKMKELKKQGYTAVVPLLHPAVVPFEPKLLAEEKENAKEIGLDVIHLPMLPWISDNATSIDSLRHFIKHATGKYYIHCYLGKDRVNVARRIIEQEKGIEPEMTGGLTSRNMSKVEAFERGKVYKLEDGVYLSPMPTQEEYVGYVIAANFRYIVSLSDSREPGSRAASEKEEKWLDTYQMPYKVFYITQDISEQQMQRVLDSIKLLPKPILIHSFRTAEPMAQMVLKMYK